MTIKTLATEELTARLQLYALPHIGPQRYFNLLRYFHTAHAALSASSQQWQKLGVPREAIESRRSAAIQAQVQQTLNWLDGARQHVLFHDSVDYPALLSETPGAPPILFVAGDPAVLQTPQLAVVGSRHASPTGLQLAEQFAKYLASAGGTITSGLALGIDTAAHQGALAGQGKTIAVVGTGLLQTYPKRNQRLSQQIIERGGAIVSELGLATGPHASHFPRRNRIISGLSLGVLVVEAGVGSGSLITARYAAEQGRDVFAIPGSIHHPGSKGCHQLIREGAILVESVQDVLAEWQHWYASPMPPSVASAEEHAVTGLLREQPLDTNTLAELLQLPLAELLSTLTELEMDGCIQQHAGLWFFLPD